MNRLIAILPCVLLSACSYVQPAFREGEVAIAHNFGQAGYNGSEVRITGGLAWREVHATRDVVRPIGNMLRCYEVTTADGRKFAAQEFQLKKAPDERAGL